MYAAREPASEPPRLRVARAEAHPASEARPQGAGSRRAVGQVQIEDNGDRAIPETVSIAVADAVAEVVRWGFPRAAAAAWASQHDLA
jgi:hypothetical protein